MDDFMKLRLLYKLKGVYRHTTVGDRNESSAEHSWSALVLADYLLDRMDMPLDRQKVYELLIYHDVVEIEAGDTPMLTAGSRKDKNAAEMAAMEHISTEIPAVMGNKYRVLFKEFNEAITPEARFAKAVDKLDAVIHALDNKKDYTCWSEEILRRLHKDYFSGFPLIEQMFERIIEFLNAEGYFEQGPSVISS